METGWEINGHFILFYLFCCWLYYGFSVVLAWLPQRKILSMNKNSAKRSELAKASTQNFLTESRVFIVIAKYYVKNNALKESVVIGGTLRTMGIKKLKNLLSTLQDATLRTQTELARRIG